VRRLKSLSCCLASVMIVLIQEEMLAMLPPTSRILADHSVSDGLSGRDGGCDGGGGDAGSKAGPSGGSSGLSRGGSAGGAKQAPAFQGGDGRNDGRSSSDGGPEGRAMARNDRIEPSTFGSSCRRAVCPSGEGLYAVHGGVEGRRSAGQTTVAGQTGYGQTVTSGAAQGPFGSSSRLSLPAGLHKISGGKKDRERDKMARQEPFNAKVCAPLVRPAC
jgi:hypothetical protein